MLCREKRKKKKQSKNTKEERSWGTDSLSRLVYGYVGLGVQKFMSIYSRNFSGRIIKRGKKKKKKKRKRKKR
ncbi:hypothetical protein VN97_g4089 [Penicillium thymicola]|uniref:Uncharacterized protein n=1 Tax=Penicillium thymicola TaxID=293382 RepID=A0AAI9X9Y5_PENTH|nr:hypothetical protein VN97_g4089 [Penicillium thymicola]